MARGAQHTTAGGTGMPRGEGGSAPGEPGLTALRAELIRALEACERGLAAAYRREARRLGPRLPDERRALERAAVRHLAHAAALRRRHGRVAAAREDWLWVAGPTGDPATLARAEQRAYDTLHDCLSDLDGETREVLLSSLLPDHVESLRRAFARA